VMEWASKKLQTIAINYFNLCGNFQIFCHALEMNSSAWKNKVPRIRMNRRSWVGGVRIPPKNYQLRLHVACDKGRPDENERRREKGSRQRCPVGTPEGQASLHPSVPPSRSVIRIRDSGPSLCASAVASEMTLLLRQRPQDKNANATLLFAGTAEVLHGRKTTKKLLLLGPSSVGGSPCCLRQLFAGTHNYLEIECLRILINQVHH
jgi:hypothetical protein